MHNSRPPSTHPTDHAPIRRGTLGDDAVTTASRAPSCELLNTTGTSCATPVRSLLNTAFSPRSATGASGVGLRRTHDATSPRHCAATNVCAATVCAPSRTPTVGRATRSPARNSPAVSTGTATRDRCLVFQRSSPSVLAGGTGRRNSSR